MCRLILSQRHTCTEQIILTLQFCLLILIGWFFWPLFYFMILYLNKGLIFQNVPKTCMRMWHIIDQATFTQDCWITGVRVAFWAMLPGEGVQECVHVHWQEPKKEGPSVEVLFQAPEALTIQNNSNFRWSASSCRVWGFACAPQLSSQQATA